MPLALRAILLVLLALLPAALVQVHQAREARDARGAALEAEALRLALLVAGEQDRVFEGARQLLTAMAAHESVRAARPSDECNAYMRRVLEAFPRYTAAQSVGLGARTICAPDERLVLADVSDRAWFHEALRADGFALGEVVVGRGNGVRTLHAAMPFRDAAGERAGVLVIGLSLEWLNLELARVPIPAGATLLLADRNGTVAARAPDDLGLIGRQIPQLGRDLLDAPAPGTSVRVGPDGVRRILGFVPVGQTPVGLYVGAALDPAAGEAAATEAALGNVALITVSLVLGFGILLAAFQGEVTRPVEALLAAAARWRAGDWSARVDATAARGGSEFARLASAFNALAETVADRERARERSDLRLRALIELSPQIVFLADANGAVTWVNSHWERVTGLTRAASLGAGWAPAIHPDDLPAMRAAWEAVVARARDEDGTGAVFEREFRVGNDRDGWRWHLSRAAPALEDGRAVAWTGIIADVDALKRAEAEAAANAARLAATYATAPVGLALLDRELRFVALNDAMASLNRRPKEEHLGRTLAEVAPHVARHIEPLLHRVIATGEAVDDHELTLPASPAGPEQARLCAYHPVRDVAGEVVGVSASVVDITARRRAEQTERLLMREVDHRARNALAVVRSLVRLSATEANGGDPAGLVEVLEGRISAMARAHTLLSNARWSGGDLRQLVTEELAAHAPAVAAADGPDATLAAEAVQPLAMALHELVTNAAKHGALSRPEGRITLRWMPAEGGGLVVEWVERGGPRLEGPPARGGFGLRLVEANLTGLLDGAGEWHWEPEGLRSVLRIGPAALLAGPAATPPEATAPAGTTPGVIAPEFTAPGFSGSELTPPDVTASAASLANVTVADATVADAAVTDAAVTDATLADATLADMTLANMTLANMTLEGATPATAAPSQAAQAEAAPPAAPPAAPRRRLDGARVLLVEDEVLVALEVARLLESAGCSVAGPAFTLEEGLALAAAQELDAAVLDLNLRGRTSVPILEELRGRGVPCLITSGYGEAPAGHAEVPVLEKPVPAARLLLAVEQAVANRRATVG